MPKELFNAVLYGEYLHEIDLSIADLGSASTVGTNIDNAISKSSAVLQFYFLAEIGYLHTFPTYLVKGGAEVFLCFGFTMH